MVMVGDGAVIAVEAVVAVAVTRAQLGAIYSTHL